MKREGRQHGMVRTHTVVPLNDSSTTNKLSPPATSGLFTLVPHKPTNHSSKFTGKRSCGRPGCLTCHHQHPTAKSKNKAKGANKLKSNDVLCNARLVSYRVVNEHHHGLLKLKYSGFSASKILDQLENSYHSSHSFYKDDDDDRDGQCEYSFNGDGVFLSDYIEKERDRKIRDEELHDDDDDDMSFCELGFVMYDEIEGDEDWCLVAELM